MAGTLARYASYEHANDGYRSLGFISTAVRHPSREAYVNAVDAHYTSPGGQFQAAAQVIGSEVAGSEGTGVGGILDVGYMPRQGISHYVSFDAFDKSIELNDMGYLRRNDYRRAAYGLTISRSDLARFRESRSKLRVYRGWNTNGDPIDSKLSFEQEVTLHNLTKLRIEAELEPARYDDRSSFGNGTFRVDDTLGVEGRYESDSSLFVVYRNNAALAGNEPASFADLFSDTFDETTGEQLAIKLRYRFGS